MVEERELRHGRVSQHLPDCSCPLPLVSSPIVRRDRGACEWGRGCHGDVEVLHRVHIAEWKELPTSLCNEMVPDGEGVRDMTKREGDDVRPPCGWPL